jgi:mono/diheme cytochrome c family protein
VRVRIELLVVALAFGATVLAAGCGSTADGMSSADTTNGKALFTANCGGCHVLADAGTTGQVGPDLDWAFGYSRDQGFEESTFYEVVLQQIALPNKNGGMPADLVTGQDAMDVAAYVARVAGTGGSAEGG